MMIDYIDKHLTKTNLKHEKSYGLVNYK